MNNKRITVFKNGDCTYGHVTFVPSTFDELLNQLSLSHKMNAQVLYNKHGGTISNIELIRDGDVLYIAELENFIPPTSKANDKHNGDWIHLNVGGRCFTTSKDTLVSDPDSMLAHMFAQNEEGYLYQPSMKDANGAYLIDRNPTYFEPILNYLRNGKLIYNKDVNPEGILEEARFFSIQSLIPQLEDIVIAKGSSIQDQPLTRREVVDALIRSAHNAELRFQGVNLAGADLSKLDLRNINFKYANLKGCKLAAANLSWCCLERADLSHTLLEGAQLLGVRSLCANFEGAVMRNCNFEDPGGIRANMEGVNLKGADLEYSQMGGINLRVATLKHANLKNCDLRSAVLAGADLENCDLSGSDLHEANLRGANLKDAAFELMLTPLHMSQTIR